MNTTLIKLIKHICRNVYTLYIHEKAPVLTNKDRDCIHHWNSLSQVTIGAIDMFISNLMLIHVYKSKLNHVGSIDMEYTISK